MTIGLVLLQLDNTITTDLPVYGIAISAVVLVAILFLGSLAAGAEVAFFTLQSKEVNYLKIRDDNASIQIVQLIEQPSSLLSAIKSMKVLASIIIVLCVYNLTNIFGSPYMSHWTVLTITAAISLVILLLVMEVIPKMYARQNNLRMAMFSVPFVSAMHSLFKNFVPSAEHSEEESDLKSLKSNILPQEELREAIQLRLGHEPSKEELDIFKGIIRFSEVVVREVMQPRMNISGIREEWSLEKVKDKVLKARFSRMPVYRETIDHIIGMLYTKDLVRYMDEKEADWHELIRPAFYVHEGKLIEDLFQEFQNRRIHAAIVVDEFGGTSGLVTLEDIMEEVVGEIRDEFDEDVLNFKKIDDFTYIFDGKTLINEMCRILGVDYTTFEDYKGESTSLAGLVLELAKKFPELNEVFVADHFEFTVLGIESLHIERVKVKVLPEL